MSEGHIAVAMIVARARNGVIGNNNELPWHLPEDLRYFKEKTLNKPIVMGRKTFDSIGRPLPKRFNIVVSRDPQLSIDGARVVATLEQALELARLECETSGAQEIMIVGGQQIYKMAMPLTDRIYMTEIDMEPPGDAFFPELDPSLWQEVAVCSPEKVEGSAPYRFSVYERVAQKGV